MQDMLLEEFQRTHSCCFTGHRPEKLQVTEEVLRAQMEKGIDAAIKDGFTVFISGMSRGADIVGAEIVLERKASGIPVKLVAASPYEGFENTWPASWKQRYREIILNADDVHYIVQTYHRSCFQRRNIWMVDRSNRVLAAYNGSAGGTKNTIKYAEKQGIEVVNVLCL
jgi:uncharacterized phage-like protein YoqJ